MDGELAEGKRECAALQSAAIAASEALDLAAEQLRADSAESTALWTSRLRELEEERAVLMDRDAGHRARVASLVELVLSLQKECDASRAVGAWGIAESFGQEAQGMKAELGGVATALQELEAALADKEQARQLHEHRASVLEELAASLEGAFQAEQEARCAAEAELAWVQSRRFADAGCQTDWDPREAEGAVLRLASDGEGLRRTLAAQCAQLDEALTDLGRANSRAYQQQLGVDEARSEADRWRGRAQRLQQDVAEGADAAVRLRCRIEEQEAELRQLRADRVELAAEAARHRAAAHAAELLLETRAARGSEAQAAAFASSEAAEKERRRAEKAHAATCAATAETDYLRLHAEEVAARGGHEQEYLVSVLGLEAASLRHALSLSASQLQAAEHETVRLRGALRKHREAAAGLAEAQRTVMQLTQQVAWLHREARARGIRPSLSPHRRC